MTGGLGTILDNASREGTNRGQLKRLKDFQQRIRDAYRPKIAYDQPKEEGLSEEEHMREQEVIVQIRARAKREKVKNRVIMIFLAVLFVAFAIGFFLYVMS
jgi:hypothetical protein